MAASDDFFSGVSAKLRGRPQLAAYGAVVAACIVVAGLGALLRTVFVDVPLYWLFSPIIVFAAIFGGAGPGLAATVLGLGALSLLGGGNSGSVWYLFAALGALISLGGDWVFRTRRDGDRDTIVLSEREAHLRSIYDTAPDALIVIDARGAVQSYSAAAERMFGWTASEVLGRNVSMLMAQPDRNRHDAYLGRYLDTGERRIIGIGRVVIGERKDGSTFPIELAVGEVRSERGRFFTGFLRDLSERQATEARLQELQAELVQMARLTALGEMASALAHELNQPLSAIANYLSGARRIMAGEGDARALDALDKAQEQALRAGEIIRRLRDFLSRGEAERRVESLPKLVREACALALVGAKEHGVQVRYHLDPNADNVLVDRVPIQQVILNLVRNGLDAMEQTSRRELLVSTSVGEDGVAVLSVADTGLGVDASVAARLFQPFITTKANGMGVGLSISRTIVEAHGGRIWTEPNPGGGAVFRFTLRMAPGPSAPGLADDG
jgi:two-component system sensor kinase FixL